MSTRSGSSRRKAEQPGKVDVKKKTDKEVELVDGSDENGVDTDDDVIELPEGTVVVNPEPVDDDDSNTSKSAKKRQQKSSLSMSVELNKLMSRILCTSCGKQINPNNTGAVRRHPWLKVITCKKCYKFLKSGPIQKDKDGLDEQCRWCGEGGKLYGCDYCHNTFCRPCIKRNLGRAEATKVEEGAGKWKCYVCKPYLLKELVENCNKVMSAIEKEEQKEKARGERQKEREKEAMKKDSKDKVKEVEDDKKSGSKVSSATRSTLRAPVPKSSVVNDTNKTSSTTKSTELIVIPDSSSDKSTSSAERKTSYILVEPKPRQPVAMPYISKTFQVQPVNNQGNKTSSNFYNNPSSHSSPMLLSAIQANPSGNAYSQSLLQKPAMNEILDLLQTIYPYNVDSSVDKLIAAAQAFSLSLNSIKTDLAIAKLTSVNMYNARQVGASSLKQGLAVFLNSVREIFNVKITATTGSKPGPSTSSSTIVIDGKQAGTNLATAASEYLSTSTPVKVEASKEKLDVSEIPILIEDSPMKKSASEPVINDRQETTSESKDDSCVVESQSEEKNSDSDKPGDKEGEEKDKKVNGVENDSALEIDEEEEEVVDEEKLKKVNETSRKIAEEYQKLAEKITQAGDGEEDTENLAARLELLKEMADELTQELGDEDGSENNEEEEEEGKRTTRSKSSQKKSDKKSKGSSAEQENLETDETSLSGPKRPVRSSTESRTREKTKSVEDGKEVKSPEQHDKDKNTKSSESVSEKQDSAEVSPAKSDTEKNMSKGELRSTRLRSKKDETTEDEADMSTESQKSTSKNKSGGVSVKDKPDTQKSNTDDDADKITETLRADRRTIRSKSGSKESKEKVKTRTEKVTEIVSDEETDISDVEGDAMKNKDGALDSDSDDSDDFQIEDSFGGTRSRHTKTKGKTAESKSKSKRNDDKSEKGNKSKQSTKKGEGEDNEDDYKSDSSNFDPDLEKEIKGIEKTLANELKGKKKVKGKESQEGSEVEEQKEKKVGKEKKKGGKKGKKSDVEISSGEEDNQEEEVNEEEEEEEDDEDNLSPSQLRKLRAARDAAKEREEEDEEEENMEDESDASSDPEVSFPKMQTPKKGKKKADEDMSEDSDFEPTKRKRLRSKLLDAKLSEDDSEVEKPKKGRKGGKRKRKATSEEEEEEEDEEEEEEEEDSETEDYSDEDNKKKKKKGKGKKGKKAKGKKRRRIKKMSSSEEEGEDKEPGASDEIDDDDDEGQGGFMKRKKIRKVMKNKKLTSETKQAQKAEEERRKRIAERQKEYNSYIEVEGEEDEEDLPEGVERAKKDDQDQDDKDEKKEEGGDSISKILGSPRKVPITTKLVLEMDKEKKKALIEVDKKLIRKLKPHQVDAVRFIYNCTVESMERLKKEEGSGAILAHCMGLGKTLSVITFIHTMLKSHKYTNMSKCLVVCPLNTVLNWVNEFEIWLNDVDFEIEVFELSSVKINSERANMLKEWHSGGAGVMIMGYDMFRNLVTGSHCKNKKQKTAFFETLCDPGPDLVVCDEGHILKNDATSVSKAMNKIKTQRRIVLTGTPLQNNLGEYHCMVNFVKPNLLGTRKEFGNRFVNPITNGQCTDSTMGDVKLMKRRAHVLHEMLAGCVQRKDYSALTKFLPPKFEYVVSVRLSPVQMDLYQKYLDLGNSGSIQSKGARLFKDYQALMRIWTHPWVLKLDEIRQENKVTYDDSEDSFIDDEGSETDSFISDTSSDGDVSPVELDSESDKGKGKKKSSRRTRSNRKKSNSGSSDEGSEKGKEEAEVVRKWTSRRRGNEEGAGASWMDIGVPANEFVNKEISNEWWAEYVKEEDRFKMELSGKLVLLFEILKMCEDIGDKVLVFSQSLLSLDIIEDFLAHIDEVNQNPEGAENKDGEKKEGDDKAIGNNQEEKKDDKNKVNGEVAGGSGAGGSGDTTEKKEDKFSEYGKNWTKGADYFRMDGSTNAQNRKASQAMFNDEENYRARLFLISTKAGSLGINLVAANRVIIFDASWNPSHDIQSIFRVYRFGQVKPVYVYRFLAQGTMEEKIYERQVTKQSLSQRVVDEHQIERHFTTADLQELYNFTPDRLDDPNRKEKLPMLPKDHMLAELMTNRKEWIVTFHEHDSLLENIVEQELSEEEKKAAWEDYEEDKKGLKANPMINMYQSGFGMAMANMGAYGMQQNLMNQNMFQNLLMQGQHALGPNGVLRIVQDLKSRFPNLPPDMFQQRVQAVLRQILTQQIMQQSELQRRQLDQQQMAELNRLHQIKQQIQRQQQVLAQQRVSMGTTVPSSSALQQSLSARGSSSSLSSLSSKGSSVSLLNQNQNSR